jgi:type I restriction-modification system DNA methylase subunit
MVGIMAAEEDQADMSLTLQELKSHLWNCAEILRGSAVDRTDWKAYILPLLFFKRFCDVWDEETAEAAWHGFGHRLR